MNDFEKYKDLYWKEINSGGNLTRLCNLTEEYLGNPVAITLTTITIIAKSKNYNQTLIEEYISHGKYLPEESQKSLYGHFDADFMTGVPTRKAIPYSIHHHICCGCVHNGELIGVLDMPIIHKTPSQQQIDIMAFASNIFAIALILNGHVTKDYYHPMQNYIINLLNGSAEALTYHNPYHINSLLGSINSFRLIWVLPDQEDTLLNSKLEKTVVSFCKKHKNIWTASYLDGYVIVYEAKKHASVLSFAEKIANQSTVILSDIFSSITKINAQIRLAEFSLNMAKQEGLLERFIYTDNYKLFFAASMTIGSDDSHLYDSELYRELLEYDTNHNSYCIETLKAYFKCNHDVARMSEMLCVHKNTVFYRLNKIKEQFQLNFDDIKQMSNLYYSIFSKH